MRGSSGDSCHFSELSCLRCDLLLEEVSRAGVFCSQLALNICVQVFLSMFLKVGGKQAGEESYHRVGEGSR